MAGANCGDPATSIHRVQGSGARSPLVGNTVTVEGVLTHDARGPDGFHGFYLQQPDAEADNDPATSEALFVYTQKHEGRPGQRLRVTGTVKEYHGLTELVDIQDLSVCGPGEPPQPIKLALPWPRPPEALENMLVRFPEPLTIVDNHNLALYGELALAATDQLTPTEYLPPGPRARARSRDQHRNRVTLDDGRAVRGPDPIPWPTTGLAYENTLRAGDTVTGLFGILDYRFDQWRLQPTRTPVFDASTPRPKPPAPAATQTVRVMALNLHNYFNGDGQGAGFPTARGAKTLAQWRSQKARVTDTVQRVSPHILAVSELENDGYDEASAIAELSQSLGPQWRFIATPGKEGGDRIRTALLYRSDRVTPEGKGRRLQSGPYAYQGRPPLAQDFRLPGRGKVLRVVVAHLKSKSCRNADGPNTEQGDGQGCYNPRRLQETQAILGWLKALPKKTQLAGTLIAGDLNSYAREAPLLRFEAAGYQSLVHRFHPCTPGECNHHSYRFQGRKGSLDYLLGSATLVDQVTGARSWNINADEPRALGYTELPSGQGPWRASDHNPVFTDIRLDR
ncbi:ExeM/NucH family extracellular endonuclease [Marinobacter nauticus]